MNGAGIANAIGGVSLMSVVGLAVLAGEYKGDVDLLMEERADREQIMLEQRDLQNEQKALKEDVHGLVQRMDAILLEIQRSNGGGTNE